MLVAPGEQRPQHRPKVTAGSRQHVFVARRSFAVAATLEQAGFDQDLQAPRQDIGCDSQALLERALIFRPEPYVRRLVFIATPHGGSPVADGPLGRLGLVLSRPQGNTARIGAELEAAYGPGSYNGGLRGETFSLRNLSASSRVMQGLRSIPIEPSVPHHSIVLQLKHHAAYGRGDGLVPYESSHLPSATSEVLVPGFHVQVGQQGVTDELRRILRIHLQEIGADLPTGASDARSQQASAAPAGVP